jgi:hypothetical protein
LPALDPNTIHVINGDIAAGNLQQAISVANRLIVSRDVLSCGPIIPFVDLGAWKEARSGYWRDVAEHDAQIDLRPAQNGIWENQHRLASASRITAWVATGNTDQLFVAFLLQLLERLGSDPGRLELVEFFQVPPAGRRVVQMGELEIVQMRMHPAPRALTMDEWMSYRNAWHALTADQPYKVKSFDADNPQASPHLKRAVRHVLRRYPDHGSGLDFWDRELLRNVRKRGPRAARVIGYTMGEHFDEGDLIGDLYFFWRLLEMSSAKLPQPLLSRSGDGNTMQGTHFELTDFGGAVVEGRASSWPVNPVDYWAGGVHISSAANNLWFVDDGGLSHG